MGKFNWSWLNAFDFVNNPDRFSDLQLACSVYFDLPNSYQAFLFATINSNQKKVDRSLALDLFGYNVDDEPAKAWTPEKFAVFLSRKLNTDKPISPLYQHIKVAPLKAENLFEEKLNQKWFISTATIVDGICSLISTNAKRDRVRMQQKAIFGRDRDVLLDFKDSSPLRSFFIQMKDQTIYDTVINYFTVLDEKIWKQSNSKSYIIKTVGIQASFDVLKLILLKENSSTPSKIDFSKYISTVTKINFSDRFYQASGIGRSRIKNTIALASGIIEQSKLKKNDLPFFLELLKGNTTGTGKDKWKWEEDAENAIINILEHAEWNYKDRSVSLFVDGEYEKPLVANSYTSLIEQLSEMATSAFISSLPSDNEFADEQMESFDAEDLVLSHLNELDVNLKKMNWK